MRSQVVQGNKIILDTKSIAPIVKVTDSEYRWQIKGIDGKAILTGKEYFSNQKNAFRDYLYTLFEWETSWEQCEANLQLVSKSGKVLAEALIKSEAEGDLIKEQTNQLLNPNLVTKEYLKETKGSYGFELRNAANRVLLESANLYDNRNLIANQLESFSIDRYDLIPVDQTHFSIVFNDEKGNVIASTREPVSDPETYTGMTFREIAKT